MSDPSANVERPWWREVTWWRRAMLTYAVALAGAFTADALTVPLPWMLGPFFACGAVSAFGARLEAIPFGREFGQLTVGLAIGLRFTTATLLATLSLLPAMLLATLYVMAYTMVAAFIFRPLAKVNRSTAFFATAAGGVADMAILAGSRGGESSSVAMVHALRVSLTVAIVPIFVVAFGTPGDVQEVTVASGQSILWIIGAVAAALLLVRALKGTALPNPWLVGPMFLGIVLGANGLLTVAMPPVAILAAQLLIGSWLGCRFQREIITALPRVALSGVAVSLFMIVAAFAGALVMSEMTPLSPSVAFLALAPAAVTEMVITAKVMHLDAEIVTAFHVMRIFIVCSTVLFVYRIYNRLQGVSDGSRI